VSLTTKGATLDGGSCGDGVEDITLCIFTRRPVCSTQHSWGCVSQLFSVINVCFPAAGASNVLQSLAIHMGTCPPMTCCGKAVKHHHMIWVQGRLYFSPSMHGGRPSARCLASHVSKRADVTWHGLVSITLHVGLQMRLVSHSPCTSFAMHCVTGWL
jgi:hypothetical protein